MSDPRTEVWTVDISEDNDLSNYIDKGSLEVVGVEVPAAVTSASISFLVSNDLTNWKALTWEGTAVSFTIAADDGVSWDPAKFAGWRYIKLKTASAEVADRTFTPLYRDYR